MGISITVNTALPLIKGLQHKITRTMNTVGKLVERRLKSRIRLFKKTGKMLSSIELIVKASSANIIVDVPYANIQDKGGKIEITPEMRKKMWALYSQTGNEMYKRIAITKQDFIVIKAKNYTNDAIDVKEIEREILKYIMK